MFGYRKQWVKAEGEFPESTSDRWDRGKFRLDSLVTSRRVKVDDAALHNLQHQTAYRPPIPL